MGLINLSKLIKIDKSGNACSIFTASIGLKFFCEVPEEIF